jgi:hypothetical protein
VALNRLPSIHFMDIPAYSGPLIDEKPAKPFFDEDEDLAFFDMLHNGCEALSEEQKTSWAAIDWKEAMQTPLFVGLPCLIYFESKKPHSFPTGRLWAVLMELNVNKTKRPSVEGTVFVCANQTRRPPKYLSYYGLHLWAMNETNCPSSLRFKSLSYCLRKLCGGDDPQWRCVPPRSDGYFQGTMCWTVDEWGLLIHDLIKRNVDWIPSEEVLKPEDVPVRSKKPNKKRKKTEIEDSLQAFEAFQPELIGSPSFISSSDDWSCWN